MRTKCFAVLFLLSWPATASAQQREDSTEAAFTRLLVRRVAAGDAATFRRLLDAHWRYQMREFPEYATSVGYPGRNDRWTAISEAAIERRKRIDRTVLQVVRGISRTRLPEAERISYDLFRKQLELDVEGQRFPGELMPLTQRSGVHLDIPETLRPAPGRTIADYEDMLARLTAAPRMIADYAALLERGLARGLTPPRVTLRDIPEQIRAQMPDDPAAAPALERFMEIDTKIPPAERDRLRNAAMQIYRDSLRPALDRYSRLVGEQYLPRARESLGRNALPDGAAWYAHDVRVFTTTSMTPPEIHALGLSEVRRIRVSMDSLISSTGFRGGFAEFVHFLRTDPQFFFTDSASLVRAYREIAKRVDPGLPKLFGKLPRLPYGVATIPSYMARSQTTAYYQSGSAEAGRAGLFYVNTFDLAARPKWEMEALSIHEAVPGHHLQIALAQELENVPEFRKHTGYTAFVEGWGLYSEGLGAELGMYQDPYSKFGQLTYEMWRAIRLVLDTGIHSMGWTRDQAIAYFRDNSAKTERDIVQEVDRYIVWPGQATAYKIGQLKILELRRQAERALGSRFDVRKFHDQVHRDGAVPLDVLEQNIRDWMAAELRKPGS